MWDLVTKKLFPADRLLLVMAAAFLLPYALRFETWVVIPVMAVLVFFLHKLIWSEAYKRPKAPPVKDPNAITWGDLILGVLAYAIVVVMFVIMGAAVIWTVDLLFLPWK